MPTAKIIVGLGNPGRQYSGTRHNLGFMVVEALAQKAGLSWKKSRQGEALAAETRIGAEKVLLLLPQTYMNNSGLAVSKIAAFEETLLENILVVCDDIRLDFGQLRLRADGSDGGHNGLKSMLAHMNGEKFFRLRMGVGAPPPSIDQADFVLASFRSAEVKGLGAFITQAVDCCELWLNGETAKAMTLYNKRKGDE
ncbi:MAG: aminoacyl-tRNA hydrolase [Candidatus Omnitrophica bacterium]|nr:aminoacyl-tRNA hydrolase [Candidatus Omnitrophota bacterium]